MSKKILYIVGDLSYPNGMSRVLSQKVNYLAEHTDNHLYVVLTEKAEAPLYYELSERVEYVNFDINFDDLNTMPLHRKMYCYRKKQRRYRQLLTDYLMLVRPDVTVSVMRREINFINSIQDGSKKIGEIHFNKRSYRVFDKPWLPKSVNRFVTSRWQKSLENEIRKLSRFVVLTYEDYSSWEGFDNVSVIPNPISYYPDHGSTCEQQQVIAVGRYTWQKGFDYLIEAWALVSQRHPDWNLKMYGAGEPDSYRKMVEQMGLQHVVSCENATRNVYEKYDESSIFVLSSRYEGLPLVLIEAMSAGLPCVSFACPCGPRDVMHDGEDGFLVATGDVKGLANGICRLIEDAEMRKRFGMAARKNVERFKEEHIMAQWIKLFESL